MFENGLGEWVLVVMMMLFVLGPKKLIVVMGFVGAVVGRARNTFASVRAEIEKDLPLEEARELGDKIVELRPSNVKRRLEGAVTGKQSETGT
ncbi:sec-independent protein translocase protein TatB [Halopseudomonas xinjiangensis]|uniref:Sec-independent protein translocase protein TatB n=1 Tax=Halopseudomonas xinjiangensis TaxID=487184 RepID=A0A1H1UCT8_9GAMM|nr:hypothetical protein [Halopseudomonas xinjiangensis]SDS70243.1 sec-independent protein translocase protein TatB [Halopseudomonas xinjiangensis]